MPGAASLRRAPPLSPLAAPPPRGDNSRHSCREADQFSETPALGTPALGRIIAEILRIERLERSTALGAGALGRMHRQLAVIIKGEQTALPEPQRFINKLPGSAGLLPRNG